MIFSRCDKKVLPNNSTDAENLVQHDNTFRQHLNKSRKMIMTKSLR